MSKQRANSKGIGGHTKPNSGATDDWITPREIVEALGQFDVDPCCPPGMPWRTATTMWTNGLVDGLTHPWRGRVWLNPPYGSQTANWLRLMADHNRGTALIFARTETDMFHRYIWDKASAILFFRGRLHFHYLSGIRAKGNAGGPSVLVAYGSHDRQRLQESKLSGHFVELRT